MKLIERWESMTLALLECGVAPLGELVMLLGREQFREVHAREW